MKRILAVLCLIIVARMVSAETNYVYASSGFPLVVGTTCTYDIVKDSVTIGSSQLGGIDWTAVKLVMVTNALPNPFTNISQVVYEELLPNPASEWKYSIKKTPQWQTLLTDLDGYSPLMDKLTNSISQVVDNKTRAALNDAKSLIKQLQQEIKDLKSIIGKLNQYEP